MFSAQQQADDEEEVSMPREVRCSPVEIFKGVGVVLAVTGNAGDRAS